CDPQQPTGRPAMLKPIVPALAAFALLGAACMHTGEDQANSSAATAPPAAPAPEAAPPPSASVPTAGAYTDDQLRAFVAASAQVDPINHSLATAAPAQRAALVAQIRTVLQQHNLDAATYNAIAAQAQTDTALASRIAAIQTATPH